MKWVDNIIGNEMHDIKTTPKNGNCSKILYNAYLRVSKITCVVNFLIDLKHGVKVTQSKIIIVSN